MPNFVNPEDVPKLQRPGKLISWLREAGYGEPIAYEPNPLALFIRIVYSETTNLVIKPRTVILNTTAESIEITDEELCEILKGDLSQCQREMEQKQKESAAEQLTMFG